VRGWNEGWFTAAQRVGNKIAQLIGAGPDEVIIADSTSVNLFKLVVAVLQARSERHTIVTDELNFPSDQYILQGAVRLAGPDYRLRVVPSTDGLSVAPGQMAPALDDDAALLALTHTTFKSGYVYDMQTVTELAHAAGAWMLWDLCHSVGAMPLALNACQVDLAVGCTYKYLNAGPGAPAFLFVRRELQEQLFNPIWGWFGGHEPFRFASDYTPAAGIRRFQVGTPPMLSLAAIEPGVDLVLEAGLERIRAKSARQTDFLRELWSEFLQPCGVGWNSPWDARQRGAHVSLSHPEGLRLALGLDRDEGHPRLPRARQPAPGHVALIHVLQRNPRSRAATAPRAGRPSLREVLGDRSRSDLNRARLSCTDA
jgi:kynureninase